MGMIGTTRRAGRATPLLPEGTVEFLVRRAWETAGVALAALGIALVVALASYHGGDPSWNTSVPAAPRNLMGLPGSYAADALMQTVGVAALLLPLALITWGWRIGTHRGLRLAALRLAAAAIAALLAAIALGSIVAPAGWLLPAGPGGAAGLTLARGLGALVEPWIGMPALAVGAAASLLASACALFALGLSAAEWGGVASVVMASLRALVWCGRQGVRLVRGGISAVPRRRRFEPRIDRPPRRIEPMLATGPSTEGKPEIPASLVAPRGKRPSAGKRAAEPLQATLDLGPSDEYRLPSLEFLVLPSPVDGAAAMTEEALTQNARLLEGVLDDFGVRGKIVKVRPGPVVTLYELEPAAGTKSSRVIGLADDIARSMSAVSVRVAVVPGRNVIGIELPNRVRETVALRELLGSSAYERTSAQLTLALGKEIGGAPVLADLSRMPHLLIAGTTGSGKSVAINTMILSLLYRLPPDACRIIMIDPKMLELSVYDGIPHLLAPVVTDAKKAVVALRWAVREMEARYRAMSHLGVRNIASYNARLAEAAKRGEALTRTVQTGFDAETGAPVYEEQPLDLEKLPMIVVIVDEMADLMLLAGKEVEGAVQRLAQMARAAGIHLIMATQRPSVDVITGTIKANFPTRISFQVTSKIDSRTILAEGGAEQLLGQGDMLYMAGGGRLMRVHGPLVTDEEVERVVGFLKAQGEPVYVDSVTEDDDEEGALFAAAGGDSGDALYDQAVALVCRERKASTSFVQRHLQIGYNRAARLIERMEAEGVISKANHVGKREVLARDVEDRVS